MVVFVLVTCACGAAPFFFFTISSFSFCNVEDLLARGSGKSNCTGGCVFFVFFDFSVGAGVEGVEAGIVGSVGSDVGSGSAAGETGGCAICSKSCAGLSSKVVSDSAGVGISNTGDC